MFPVKNLARKELKPHPWKTRIHLSYIASIMAVDELILTPFSRSTRRLSMGSEYETGPPFTKRTGVLPQYLVKSRSREIGCYNDRIALKFDMHLGSAATEVPVKYKIYWKSLNPNLVASRLYEILR